MGRARATAKSFDPWNWFPCHGLALGHFALEHYGEAAAAARRVQPPVFWSCNPRIDSASTLLALIVRRRLPPRCPRLCALRGYPSERSACSAMFAKWTSNVGVIGQGVAHGLFVR